MSIYKHGRQGKFFTFNTQTTLISSDKGPKQFDDTGLLGLTGLIPVKTPTADLFFQGFNYFNPIDTGAQTPRLNAHSPPT